MSHSSKQVFFGILLFYLTPSTHCLENNTTSNPFCKAVQATNNEYLKNDLFAYTVELAQKNGFKDCTVLKEILKERLQEGTNINWPIGTNKETALHIAVENQKKDLFEFLLENGANINSTNKERQTPLHYLVKTSSNYEKPDIRVKDLIKHGANVNAWAYGGITPLAIAIQPLQNNHTNSEIIQELCKLKASLTNVANFNMNNNIFHRITQFAYNQPSSSQDNGDVSIQYIKSIITHARFDTYNKNSKTILYALLAFQRLGINLPQEVKLYIFSKLPLSDLYPYKKLCAYLKRNYIDIFLPDICERVENIKKVLASKNILDVTALQYMKDQFFDNENYQKNVGPFLDGTTLQHDFDYFISHFPAIVNSQTENDKNNLVRQMFDNCAQLFLE